MSPNDFETTEINDQNSKEKLSNIDDEFSINEIKLLNLIAEIIVDASIKEYHEKGNKVLKVQR
jgi:hypothetical protein